MSKTAKAAARKQFLTAVYRKVFGQNPSGTTKETAKLLITKLAIPYLPNAVKMETFVASWIRRNKPELFPTARMAIAAAPKPKAASEPNYISVREAFYKSWDWRTLRMQALKKHGARCQCCGATKDSVDISGNQVRIVVDHIQPLARRWDLRLDLENLQILCDECNMGKGAWDRTDWRNV